MADCGHALCLPYDVCRFVVRTQAERDADGQAWRPGGVVAGEPVHVEMHPDECVVVAREGVGLMCARADHDHSPIVGDFGPGPEPPRPPRRRWWHRYTRRNP